MADIQTYLDRLVPQQETNLYNTVDPNELSSRITLDFQSGDAALTFLYQHGIAVEHYAQERYAEILFDEYLSEDRNPLNNMPYSSLLRVFYATLPNHDQYTARNFVRNTKQFQSNNDSDTIAPLIRDLFSLWNPHIILYQFAAIEAAFHHIMPSQDGYRFLDAFARYLFHSLSLEQKQDILEACRNERNIEPFILPINNEQNPELQQGFPIFLHLTHGVQVVITPRVASADLHLEHATMQNVQIEPTLTFEFRADRSDLPEGTLSKQQEMFEAVKQSFLSLYSNAN